MPSSQEQLDMIRPLQPSEPVPRIAPPPVEEIVWRHHVPVGREFGVTDRELHAVCTGEYDGFPAREQALLALTDELVEARTIRRSAARLPSSAHAPAIARPAVNYFTGRGRRAAPE